jgi:hypothetical protein
MKGGGYYDRHSRAQMASIQILEHWIEEAVANLPLPDPPQAVTVLDLGSSEGRNAIRVMTGIVAELRRRTVQPLVTIFSDLASNNFNQLFANLEQARSTFPADVYPSAVGGSFYGPLLPSGSVHLATCFNSIIWLSQLPSVPILDFVGYRRPRPNRPGPYISPEATAAYTRQAHEDLVRFLECRARELVPGGKLLVASPGDTDNIHVGDGLYDVLNDAFLDLVAAGRLDRAQYERMAMPQYARTLEELLAPLKRDDSPVRGAFAVDRAETLEVPTPFGVDFHHGGDRSAYAAAYTGFLRAISEPVVRAGLNEPERQSAILDSLYERVKARLLTEPERYVFRYIIVAVLLSRR